MHPAPVDEVERRHGRRPSSGQVLVGAVVVVIVVLVALVAAFAVRPTSGTVTRSGAAPSASATEEMTDAEVDRSMDRLARLLASALREPELRSEVHAAVAQGLDGEPNVLWSTLAGSPAFSEKIAGNEGDADAVAAEAARIPLLQIGVPVHFDDWDPESYAPLVAVMPISVEDTTIDSISAYRASGEKVALDAQVEPEQPVIVVTLDETSD